MPAMHVSDLVYSMPDPIHSLTLRWGWRWTGTDWDWLAKSPLFLYFFLPLPVYSLWFLPAAGPCRPASSSIWARYHLPPCLAYLLPTPTIAFLPLAKTKTSHTTPLFFFYHHLLEPCPEA